MNRRLIAAAMATSLSFLTVQTVSAAPRLLGGHSAVGDKAIKQKNISFHLRNDTNAPLNLKAGDQQMTVKPGETASLKLPLGQQIVAVDGTASIAAGGVVATVTSNLDGNTLAVR